MAHTYSLSALLARSNPSLSFPFSLLSLRLSRHAAEQTKSQHCFRREPLSSDTAGEEPAGRESSLREGEVAEKGGRHGERREKVKKREKTLLALICGNLSAAR